MALHSFPLVCTYAIYVVCALNRLMKYKLKLHGNILYIFLTIVYNSVNMLDD